jgi:hypothetical protein
MQGLAMFKDLDPDKQLKVAEAMMVILANDGFSPAHVSEMLESLIEQV